MKRLLYLFVLVLMVSGALNGCTVDKITPPVAVTTMPGVISTSLQGAQAVSQVMQTEQLLYNTAVLLKAFGSHGIYVMNYDPTLSLTAPVSCADYGEYTYTGSVDGSGNFNLTLTFSLCRENGFQYDGAMIVLGTPASISATLGGASPLRIVDYNDSSYAAITGIISASNLTFTMTDTSAPTVESYNIRPSGLLSAFDYVMLGQFSVVFNSVQMGYSMMIDAVTSDKTTIVTANGSTRQTWPGGYLRFDLTNFTVTMVEQFAAAGPPPTYSGSDTAVTGTATYDFGSSSAGVEGILTVATSTPVHHSYTTGKSTAGTVTVTGNGSATAVFNPGGDIVITANGGAAVNYAGEYYLNKVVNFYGMEQAPPQFMGKTGAITTPGAIAAQGSRWAATMTVTALSSGPALNCYTDVHVLYFSPLDLLVPKITWYVDWNIGLVDGCAPPLGIPFEEARDVAGDTSCDAGLDINGADQDITSGGVEHFTATLLQEGYYIVSIDNWSCATSVANMASIIIGDYLFGTYNCSYTSADGDGSTPGAWCRLADLQVNADGSFAVLAPNPAYNPWHN